MTLCSFWYNIRLWRTDRQRDGRTSVLLQYQRMYGYRAAKNSSLSLSFLGPSPRLPTGALLLDPSPRLLCFTQSNFKSWIRPWTWCRIFHSRVFHPCHLVPCFPLPCFPPLLLGAAFSTPAFSTLVTWCCVFHSERFQPLLLGAAFSTPAFSVNPTHCFELIPSFSAVHHWLQPWKNYWNRYIFAKIIVKIKWLIFFWNTVYINTSIFSYHYATTYFLVLMKRELSFDILYKSIYFILEFAAIFVEVPFNTDCKMPQLLKLIVNIFSIIVKNHFVYYLCSALKI